MIHDMINQLIMTTIPTLKNILFVPSHQASSFGLLERVYKTFCHHSDIFEFYSLENISGVFPRIKAIAKGQISKQKLHCVIVIGGNQVLMDVFSYFQNTDSPPIYGIANGCAPTLYNYSKFQAQDATQKIAEIICGQDKQLPTQRLMKLAVMINCNFKGQSTCQIQIHRRMDQSIIVLNIFLESPCKKKVKIGQFRGDGLLISTPMGSFCKNLSLNGPLMEKSMESIMITPICPLSMKFRPICLPSNSKMFIQIDAECRTNVLDIFMDGCTKTVSFSKGEVLRIKMSNYKSLLVQNLIDSNQLCFIKNLKSMLSWGQNYGNVQPQDVLLKKSSLLLMNLEF